MPVRGNKLFCPICDFEQPQINLISCKRCGHDLGAPNVNEVSREDEINALKERYNEARRHAAASNQQAALDAFELYFKDHVQAIINTDFVPLTAWLLDDGAYKNYYRLTQDGTRDVAKPDDDRKRNKVDGFLFGYYGRDMIFAALSLNNDGLKSYGACTVVLDETIIEPRATIIEQNSYNFAAKHDLNLEVVHIPEGYRALWDNKMELAVAKLQSQINNTCSNDDFCNLVLYSKDTGDKQSNRKAEEFMEVHIYKELSEYAIKTAYVPPAISKKINFDIKKVNSKYPGKVFVV